MKKLQPKDQVNSIGRTEHKVASKLTIFNLSRLCTMKRNPYGPRREKTCLRGFLNNTGADQPAHPRSLISAFVVRFLESSICLLATGEISIF